MSYEEIRKLVFISAQRALVGMIYPEIVGISVELSDLEHLTIKAYLDRDPNELDFENLSDITGEILADVQFKKVKEQCEHRESSKIELPDKASWVYLRKDE